jgi:hypothetical protein
LIAYVSETFKVSETYAFYEFVRNLLFGNSNECFDSTKNSKGLDQSCWNKPFRGGRYIYKIISGSWLDAIGLTDPNIASVVIVTTFAWVETICDHV